MPVDYVHHDQDKFKLDGQALVVKSAAGKGVRGLRHSIGYFNLTPDQVVFISKRLLRLRDFAIPRSKIEHVQFKKQLLLDRLVLRVAGKQHIFYFFKDASIVPRTSARHWSRTLITIDFNKYSRPPEL